MIAAVIDCMVFLQAATNPQSPAFACLAFAESNHVRLYVSPPILAEIRDVFTRTDIQARFPHLTPERVDLFVQKLATVAVLVSDVPASGFALRDPNDLPYLDLAVAVRAGYIISRDKHLLKLMKNPSFLQTFPQLRVVDPFGFLTIVRSASNAA